MDSNSLFNPIQGEVSPARHLARIKKNTSPLILPLNRGNDASAAIQCETIKISQSSLGIPCHKFQQILIILSAVTRPRTFPTEFHPIAAQLHVHRPARARNPEKLLSSSLKPTTRCVVVCCFRFVRPLWPNRWPLSSYRPSRFHRSSSVSFLPPSCARICRPFVC